MFKINNNDTTQRQLYIGKYGIDQLVPASPEVCLTERKN